MTLWNKVKQIVTKKEYLLVVFCIYLFSMCLNDSLLQYQPLFSKCVKLVRYGVYAYDALYLLCVSDLKKVSLPLICFIVFLLLIALFSHNRDLFLFFLILYASKDIGFDTIVKYAYRIEILAMVVIVLCSLFGISENLEFARSGGRVRYALGYNYPTAPSTRFFILLMMQFYLYHKNLRLTELILDLFVAGFLYYLTDSRTGFIVSVLMICVMAAVTFFNIEEDKIRLERAPRWLKGFAVALPYLVCIGIFLLIVLYNRNVSIAVKINKLISNRLKLSSKGFANYGIPLFGQKIQWIGNGGGKYNTAVGEYNFIDIAYLQILFNYGILFLLLIVFLYSKAMEKAWNENRVRLLLCIALTQIWSCLEPNLISIYYNIYLFLLLEAGIALFQKRERKELILFGIHLLI